MMKKAGICLLVFAVISMTMRQGWLTPMDTAVRELIQSPAFDSWLPLALSVTNAGEFLVQLLVCAITAVCLRLVAGRFGPSLLLTVHMSGVWVLNVGLKELYRRDRPTVRHLVEANGYSFPSGNAMSSAAFYGMVGYLLWRAFRGNRSLAWMIPFLTVLLVVLVGWSRIYLGVHFLSDILAGYAAGGFWLVLSIAFYRRFDSSG
ncbi:phosphatase PAP2 family protein [Gorillibacterium timonense]|uniref:phosphatase PAP2 family protein n=1 Tax=Gorillibacterium timonense TaxID=1689269 RepID=UPI00071D290F|nr:phosphatase PAP2 family protein [Gorillibacterium timonense]